MLNRTLTFISVFFLSITFLFLALWVHHLQNRDSLDHYWTAGEKYGYATIDVQSLNKNLKLLEGEHNDNKQKIKELKSEKQKLQKSLKKHQLARRGQELAIEALEAEIAQLENFIEAVILSDSNNR